MYNLRKQDLDKQLHEDIQTSKLKQESMFIGAYYMLEKEKVSLRELTDIDMNI